MCIEGFTNQGIYAVGRRSTIIRLIGWYALCHQIFFVNTVWLGLVFFIIVDSLFDQYIEIVWPYVADMTGSRELSPETDLIHGYTVSVDCFWVL